jgi:large subunit ribosomal protein L22
MKQENIATVYGKDLPISTKKTVEVCKFIKGKELKKAKAMLQRIIKMTDAVPYTRYKKAIPHRKGKMAGGGFPIKVCQNVLNLLNSAEANASNKGLDVNSLYVKAVMPNKAARPMHPGRQRGRRMKRTHVYLEVEERKVKKEKKEETHVKETKKKGEEKK